ncbi:hypothetical protein EJB05_09528, partial [Eragrostis curvula]
MLEPPQWLPMRRRHGEAHAVLLRTSDTPAKVDLRLEQIQAKVPDAAKAVVEQGRRRRRGERVVSE